MMRAARPFKLLLLLAVLSVAVTALVVSAGTRDNPEVVDISGASTTNRDSHDIIAAWIESEDPDALVLRMEMSELDAFSPRDDWLTLPSSIYEYYFTINETDYAARATIPVHGVFAAFASYGLYAVEYGSAGNLSYEAVTGSIPGNDMYSDGMIEMTVQKVHIGDPEMGDVMGHMWAACYFQPRGGEPETADEAMSYLYPGQEYIIRGDFTELYHVRLEASNATLEGRPNDVVTFNISVVSDGTVEVHVNLTNDSIPAGYFLNFSRNMPILVNPGGRVNMAVIVSVPKDAKNGTDVDVIIQGIFEAEGDNLTTNRLRLTIQVRFIPPKEPDTEPGIFQMIWDFVVKYYPWISAAIAAAIVVILILYLRDRQTAKGDRDLMAYQSYLDAQRQQREMGEP